MTLTPLRKTVVLFETGSRNTAVLISQLIARQRDLSSPTQGIRHVAPMILSPQIVLFELYAGNKHPTQRSHDAYS